MKTGVLSTRDLLQAATAQQRYSYPRMNGCTNASLGVIRFAGSNARHLSKRSTKDTSSLLSSSCSFTELGGISLCRRSRVGFVT